MRKYILGSTRISIAVAGILFFCIADASPPKTTNLSVTTNGVISLYWHGDPNGVYAIQSSASLVPGTWSNLTTYTAFGPYSAQHWQGNLDHDNHQAFFRLVEAPQDTILALSDSLSTTSDALLWVTENTSSGYVRTSVGVGDMDGDNEYDSLFREDIFRAGESDILVRLYSLAQNTETGRMVTVDYLSTGAISNLFAQYTSQANDNWGSVGEPVDGHDLFAFANANLPYLSAPNSTSVYLHFPITAVTNISLITLDGPYSIINPNPVIMPIYRQGHVHQWPTSFPSGDTGIDLTTRPGGTIQLRWDDRVELTYSTVESYTIRWDKIHRWDWIIRRGGSRTMPIGTREFSQEVKPGNWRVSIRADASDSENFWIINGGTMHCVVPERQVPEDGLVAYYPFDGNANDASGHGNHGSVLGATPVPGRIGGGYYFNGQDSKITIPHSSTIQLPDSFTIAFWVMLYSYNDDAVSYHGQAILGKTAQPSWLDEYHIQETDMGKIQISTANYRPWNRTAATVPLNQWCHLSFVRHNNAIRIFINGVEDANSPFANVGKNTTTTPLIIGHVERKSSSGNQAIGHFHGVLDELRLYDRALSEEEVLLLFNEEPTGIVTLSSNQVVEYNGITYEYWKQDDADSAVMHLEPGGAFHGNRSRGYAVAAQRTDR